MPLGLENIKGLNFLENVNFGGIFTGIGNLALLLFGVLLVGGVAYTIYWLRNQKKRNNQNLHFFEEVNKQMVPVEDVKARELIIPGTNIKVFYLKSKDMYMPRGTKKMGKNHYWYAIRNNREVVNFIMANLNEKMQEAGLDFDHTDMRYANQNLKAIIKRNYKDKSTKWWREYKDVISIVIFVFVITISFFFITRQVGGLIDKIGPLLDKAGAILDKAIAFERSSGIAPA